MGLGTKVTGVLFVSILDADATFRVKAKEGAPGAVKRTWNTPKSSGTKWEYVHGFLEGIITGVTKVEKNFSGGTVAFLNISMQDAKNPNHKFQLSVGFSDSYSTTFLRKLPNADLSQPIRLKAYSFIPKDATKAKRGLNLFQGEDKIEDFFFDGKNALHGIPEAKSSPQSSEYWKYYFSELAKWLFEFYEGETKPKLTAAISDSDQIEEGVSYEQMSANQAFSSKKEEEEDTENAAEGDYPSIEDEGDDLPF